MTHWSGFDAAADRRLLKRLADGSAPALADVYDIYAERLYDYALHFTDDVHVARELVHDALIDAVRRAPRMRDRRRLRPWLYGAVRRRAMTRRPDGWAPPGAGESAELRVAGAALAALDRGQRDVLWLAYRHGVEGTDLAVTLGVSTHRARRRLARAAERVEQEAVRVYDGAEAEAPAAIELVRLIPTAEVPDVLRDRVLHTAADAQLARYRSQIVARGGRLVAGGLPRQPDAPSQVVRRYAVGGTAVAAFLGVVTVGLNLVGADRGRGADPMPSWTARPGISPLPSAHGRPPSSSHPVAVPTGPGRRGDDGGHGVKPDGGSHPARPVSPRPSAHRPTLPVPVGPSLPAPPRSGTLTVRPASIRFDGSSSTATLTLTADSGPVRWTATAGTPSLSLSPDGGTLARGEAQRVTVRLSRNTLLQLPGASEVTVTGGGVHAVPVTWSASLLSG